MRKLVDVLDFASDTIPTLGLRSDSFPASQSFRTEKFLSETALLLYASTPAAERFVEVRARADRLAASLMPYARSESILALMALRPVMIPELCVGHLCLTAYGCSDPSFSDAIAGMIQVGYRVPERSPWRDLEANWIIEKDPALGLSAGPIGSIHRTVLALGVDGLAERREDLYALTHGIIYLTDFGRNHGVTLPRPLQSILADAEIGLSRCLDDDDFDLCAELLLTWPYLAADNCALSMFGNTVLETVVESVGFLPSLSLRAQMLSEPDPKRRQRELLDEGYHTAYTMGLLASANLACAPPTEKRVVGSNPGLGPACYELMTDKHPRAQWMDVYETLSSVSQDELAPFLLAVALKRSLAAGDLGEFRSILIKAVNFGLAGEPILTYAGSMLARVTHAFGSSVQLPALAVDR